MRSCQLRRRKPRGLAHRLHASGLHPRSSLSYSFILTDEAHGTTTVVSSDVSQIFAIFFDPCSTAVLYGQSEDHVPVTHEVLRLCSAALGQIPQLFANCLCCLFVFHPKSSRLDGNFFIALLFLHSFSRPLPLHRFSATPRGHLKTSSLNRSAPSTCSLRSSEIANASSSLFAVSFELLCLVARFSLISVPASCKVCLSTHIHYFPFAFWEPFVAGSPWFFGALTVTVRGFIVRPPTFLVVCPVFGPGRTLFGRCLSFPK